MKQIEGTGEVGGDQLVEILGRKEIDAALADVDAGIVDEEEWSARLGDGGVYPLLHVEAIGDVESDGVDAAGIF